jgi:hypothetical protein
MPYKLSSDGLQVEKDDGTPVGQPHKTHAEALAHLRALEANVSDAKSMKQYMTATDEPCADIRNAAQALMMVTYLAEAEEAEPGDRAKIVTIMRDFVDFLTSEIAEYESGQDEDAASEAQEQPAMMNVAYLKSLGISKPEDYFKDVLAVKSTGKDSIKGYIALWGNPALTDIESEYFTKATDFWDGVLSFPRPLTWNHGQDRSVIKSLDTIGQMQSFGDDDIGRFYEATLERSHKYRKAIDALISQRVLGTSSDSAPQYVIREKTGKATWLKQWPLFAGALTDVPCEPRMLGSVDFKSLGVDLEATVKHAEAARQALRGNDDGLKDAMRLHDLLKLS